MYSKFSDKEKEILLSSKEKSFSIEDFIEGNNKEQEIQFISHLFTNIPSINMEEILIKSSSYFSKWSLSQWKILVENMDENINNCYWGLSTFFLKYTYQEQCFIEKIGIDIKMTFGKQAHFLEDLKNSNNQKAVDFVFKSFALTPQEIERVRNFGC